MVRKRSVLVITSFRPWLCQIRKFRKKVLIVLQWIRRRLGNDWCGTPECRIVQQFKVVFFAIELCGHVQKHREESRCDLIFQSPPEGPCSGRVHVDCADVWNKNLERAAK